MPSVPQASADHTESTPSCSAATTCWAVSENSGESLQTKSASVIAVRNRFIVCSSCPGELGRALLDEGGHPFLEVVAADGQLDRHRLGVHRLVESDGLAGVVVQQPLGGGERLR